MDPKVDPSSPNAPLHPPLLWTLRYLILSDPINLYIRWQIESHSIISYIYSNSLCPFSATVYEANWSFELQLPAPGFTPSKLCETIARMKKYLVSFEFEF